MKGYVLTLGLLAGSLVLSASQASACSCYPTPTYQQNFDKVDAVFVGKVVQKLEEPSDGGRIRRSRYVFSVSKSYKGSLNTYATTVQPTNVGLCGYDFQMGETYVVWANVPAGSSNQFETSLCHYFNSPVDEAQNQLNWLEGLSPSGSL